MIEVKGDIFDPAHKVIVIPTCGVIKNNALVMNFGIADTAKSKWPELPKAFGKQVEKYGNYVFAHKTKEDKVIFSFPVKDKEHETPDIDLIIRGCERLVETANNCGLTAVYMPRVGCARGELSWDEVRPKVENLLDDRFTIITMEKVGYIKTDHMSKYDKLFKI